MLKFNRTHKRLVIPAGINPNYGIDSSALYNTSDADAKPEDILAGITAYSDNGKIVGTLDVEAEKEESFNEGVQVQKSKLESISITENGSYSREDGWDEVIVDVPDLNGDYNEGLEDGIEIGKAEIIDGMNDATITANAVLEGYIGYGKNNERIVGTNVGGFDFGEIGYSADDSNDANGTIKADIAYSKSLYDAWDPNIVSAYGKYSNNKSIVYAPNIDTSNVTEMSSMFYGCSNLVFVPLFNTSKVTLSPRMFYGCTKLTSVPLFDTSEVTNMMNMFYDCGNLSYVPAFETKNVKNMLEMFYGCHSLTTLPEFDVSKAENIADLFGGWTNYNIVNLGGFNNLGKGFGNGYSVDGPSTLNLKYLPKLTHDSCMNVINKVYDVNLNEVFNRSAIIIFHATPYALLSADDIAIATSKGWAVQVG